MRHFFSLIFSASFGGRIFDALIFFSPAQESRPRYDEYRAFEKAGRNIAAGVVMKTTTSMSVDTIRHIVTILSFPLSDLLMTCEKRGRKERPEDVII